MSNDFTERLPRVVPVLMEVDYCGVVSGSDEPETDSWGDPIIKPRSHAIELRLTGDPVGVSKETIYFEGTEKEIEDFLREIRYTVRNAASPPPSTSSTINLGYQSHNGPKQEYKSSLFSSQPSTYQPPPPMKPFSDWRRDRETPYPSTYRRDLEPRRVDYQVKNILATTEKDGSHLDPTVDVVASCIDEFLGLIP